MPANSYIFINWACGLILAAILLERIAPGARVARWLFSDRLKAVRIVVLACVAIVAAAEFANVTLYEPVFLRAQKGDPLPEPPQEVEPAPKSQPKPPKSLDFAEYWLGSTDLRLGHNLYRDMAEYIHHKSLQHKQKGTQVELAKYVPEPVEGREGFDRLEKLASDNGIPVFPHFTYPPTSYLFFMPFTFLDWRTAHDVWIVLNWLFVAASIVLLCRAIGYRPKGAEEPLALTVLILGFSPLLFSLKECQLNSLVMLLICAGLYLASLGKEASGGALLAFGAAIKIFPGILLLYFLWKRRFRLALWGFGALAIIMLISVAAAGWEVHDWYFFKVAPTWASNLRPFDMNQSIAGVVARTLVGGEGIEPISHRPRLARAAITFSQLLLLAIMLRVTRGRGKRLDSRTWLEIGLVIVFYQLASTWVLIHHLQWLLIPFLIAWGLSARGEGGLSPGLLTALSASFLLMGVKYIYYRPAFRAGAMALMASLKCYGTVLLFFALAFAVWRMQRRQGH